MFIQTNIAIAIVAPILLIFIRLKNEKKIFSYIRYSLSMIIVWFIFVIIAGHQTFINVRAAELRGDIDGMVADTGLNAVAILFGWLPSMIYIFALFIIRKFVLIIYNRLNANG